jgi:hypothetical protein
MRIDETDKPIGRSGSTIFVFKSHNVVLTEIGAGLHFHHFQRYGARILQAMSRAERNESALVFGQKKNFFSSRNPSSSIDHNPVLSAVVMHL